MSMPSLEALRTLRLLSALDERFARAVARIGGDERQEVMLAAALVSRDVGNGHACLDLARLRDDRLVRDESGAEIEGMRWPTAEHWKTALQTSPLVSSGEVVTPLVLDAKDRLYLRRYWEHERHLATALRGRAAALDPTLDDAVLRDGVRRLFPATPTGGEPDWQRVAALMAVQRRLCVISGGPGTGKTYTVVKILALLVEQALQAERRPPRMTLVAPTGKAAKRLVESIQSAKAQLCCSDAVKAAIPEEASTIHRCLGTFGGSTTRYRHNARNPLVTDVVLVDEASMVDLALMSRLLLAVPPMARVILLGDKDQLASVEAGAVLGDICNSGAPPGYSRQLATSIHSISADTLALAADAPEDTGIWDCVVTLTRSYRYANDSGIGALAHAINAGDGVAAVEILESTMGLARWEPCPDGVLHADFADAVVRGFRPFLEETDPVSRLRALDGFRVLCAHREGPYGLVTLNSAIEEALRAAGLIDGETCDFIGRPIIVSRNDYQVGLFNGDVGIILPAPGADGHQRVAFFLGPEGRERRLSPSRLPPHETVFATSVHKSQGSEFDDVIVVLPERVSPVLSRELLYTAVTRARRQVVMHASREIIVEAVRRRIGRASGLRDALWQGSAA